MALEFVDTNVFVYAHDRSAAQKYRRAEALIDDLNQRDAGAISTQVLVEFYSAAVIKRGMAAQLAESVIDDLGIWTLHRPDYVDILRAAQLRRQLKISWWDALVVNSALELGCSTLWTEDLSDGRKIGSLTIRNPFA